MATSETPLIILLGGSSGTGKTTLANALVQELGLAHHLSTGFVREAVSAVLPPRKAKLLAGFSFDAWNLRGDIDDLSENRVLNGAIAQTRLLKPAIDACISRSEREGASLVMEGTHLIPGMFEPLILSASVFCILDVPDRSALVRRSLGSTHKRRILDEKQLNSIVQLQDAYVRLGKQHGLPIIVNTDLNRSVDEVKKLLSRKSDD